MATTTKEKKPATTVRLREQYNSKYAAELKKELGLANAHQVPRLQKITLNLSLIHI